MSASKPPTTSALERPARRLRAAGANFLTDSPLDPELRDGFVFELPGGMPIEVYTGMPKDEPEYLPDRGAADGASATSTSTSTIRCRRSSC